ncbi:MAG: hypothetical protein M3545_06915 [Acidobacteriota bacterium]|nr:hypothetical protein [Acidobacteriota bacterium]
MKSLHVLLAAALCASVTAAEAQTPPAVPPPGGAATDVYNVMFVKAAPGQAAALEKQLQQQDPKDPMASHFLLLRHQEGADWDYCLIHHVGPKGSVEITPQPQGPEPATRAWHDDTFVSGPAWPEFQRLMGLTGDQSGNAVYVVGVHRAVPGHREQLVQALSQPAPSSKVTVNSLLMTHLEGGPWQFLTVDRYNSWQDFGLDRTANPAGGQGWLDSREHSAYHTDTIADRVR